MTTESGFGESMSHNPNIAKARDKKFNSLPILDQNETHLKEIKEI